LSRPPPKRAIASFLLSLITILPAQVWHVSYLPDSSFVSKPTGTHLTRLFLEQGGSRGNILSFFFLFSGTFWPFSFARFAESPKPFFPQRSSIFRLAPPLLSGLQCSGFCPLLGKIPFGWGGLPFFFRRCFQVNSLPSPLLFLRGAKPALLYSPPFRLGRFVASSPFRQLLVICSRQLCPQ